MPVPALEHRVTDLVGVLSPDVRSELERELADLEVRRGSQVAVLVVPTTGPETIEEYGIRVAESWALGRAGVDDGAILLLATEDRALRLEVGYGLEGAIPDATANRIVEDVVIPRLRLGDFDGGVTAGIDAVIGVIDGEPLPEPAAESWPGEGEDGGWGGVLAIGFILVVVVGSVLRALFGRLPAAVLVGGATGAIVWVLVASAVAALVVAIVAFLFTLIGGMPGQRRGGYRGGGWGLPSGGGWSRGGGWSGGGGGFGGGGASGHW